MKQLQAYTPERVMNTQWFLSLGVVLSLLLFSALAQANEAATKKVGSSTLQLFSTIREMNPREFYHNVHETALLVERLVTLVSSELPRATQYHELNQELNRAHAWLASNARFLAPEVIDLLEAEIRKLRAEAHLSEELKADLNWASVVVKML